MRFSSPIFKLKRQAKLLARDKDIRLHEALDHIAVAEGFKSWSHLASQSPKVKLADSIFQELNAGDLLLVGARPGHGKTLLGLELAAFASQAGRTGFVFSLDYNKADVMDRYQALGIDDAKLASVVVDTSDDICASYIIEQLSGKSDDAIVVIDYLQIMDQKRSNPPLEEQIRALRSYAKQHGIIIAFISQIDRLFDLSDKDLPSLDDIRLPNPLDLSLFDQTCFLHNGHIQMQTAA